MPESSHASAHLPSHTAPLAGTPRTESIQRVQFHSRWFLFFVGLSIGAITGGRDDFPYVWFALALWHGFWWVEWRKR